MRARHLLALALALVAAVGFAASANAEVRLVSVGRFAAPVHVSGAAGDSERLYVVEQGGTIRVVRNGTAALFADLRDSVLTGGEQGLLSVAFAPDFQTSRLLYVYFTDRNGDNRVEELRAPTGDAAEPASRRLVLTIPHQPATNHNGGQLQFGPDGLLYLAPGDGANAANARRLDTLLGKVLRIDPRATAGAAYSVPASNPYVGAGGGARPEIWASGLRNPYRFTFDRGTGDLVIGDVGEATTEEINLLPAASGGGRGAELGWNVCEGSFLLGSRTSPCTTGTLPILDRFRDEGFRSIIPGYVVRDPSLPSLLGRLVYGDFFVARLRSVVPSLPRASDDREVGVSVAQLTSLGEDAGGCVYATSAGGQVARLVETDERIPCPALAGPPAPQPPAPPTEPTPRTTTPAPPAPPTPGGGTGGTAPTAPGAGDDAGRRSTAAPRLRSNVPARQRVLRRGAVVATARCAVACRVTANARVQVGRRALKIRPATGIARAATRIRLAARLTRPARRALRTALRRGDSPRVVVTLRARAVQSGVLSKTQRIVVRVQR